MFKLVGELHVSFEKGVFFHKTIVYHVQYHCTKIQLLSKPKFIYGTSIVSFLQLLPLLNSTCRYYSRYIYPDQSNTAPRLHPATAAPLPADAQFNNNAWSVWRRKRHHHTEVQPVEAYCGTGKGLTSYGGQAQLVPFTPQNPFARFKVKDYKMHVHVCVYMYMYTVALQCTVLDCFHSFNIPTCKI